MKKRLIALLCVTALILTTFSSAFVFAESEGASRNSLPDSFDMAVAGLKEVGVFGKDENVSASATKTITRAEFANMLAKVLKVKQSTDTIYFSDVKDDYWAYNEINGLVDAGIVSRAADRRFNPENGIKYIEASKLLLCAAGYGEYADRTGGFPNGYAKLARQMGFDISGNLDADMTWGDAVCLLWDGITAAMYSINSVTSDGTVGFAADIDTILSRYYDIYVAKGVLESFYGGRIKNQACTEGEIVISGNTYLVDKSLVLDKFLGMQINFLYKYDAAREESTLVYIETDNRYDYVETEIENLASFSTDTFTLGYWKNGSKSTSYQKIARSATIVYNGEVYKDSVGSLFNEILTKNERGTVRLSNFENGVARTVVIEKVHPVIVSAISADKMVYNLYNNKERVNLKAADCVRLYDVNGITNGEPAMGKTYEVAVSKNGKMIKFTELIISLIGKGESFKNDKIIIAGNEYEIDKSCLAKYGKPELNIEYNFILDQFGGIVNFEKTTGDSMFKFGYIIAARVKEESFSGDVQIKLLDASGVIKVYNIAKRCIVDGASKKLEDIVSNIAILANKDGEVDGQVVRYRTNSKEEFIELDTTKVGSNEDANKTLSKKTNRQLNGYTNMRIKSVNGHFVIDRDTYVDNAVLFRIPNMDENGNLMVDKWLRGRGLGGTTKPYEEVALLDGNGGKMTATDDMYTVAAMAASPYFGDYDVYTCDSKSAFAPVVVWRYDVANQDSDGFVYGGTTQSLNADGDVVTNVILTSHSGTVEYELADPSLINLSGRIYKDNRYIPVTLSVGDLVSAAFDIGVKKVYNLGFIYSSREEQFNRDYKWVFGSPGSYLLGGYPQIFDDMDMQMFRGTCIRRDGTILFVDYENDGLHDSLIDMAKIPVIVFDKNDPHGEYIKKGSIDDIIDAETSDGETASIIVEVKQYATTRYVFVSK